MKLSTINDYFNNILSANALHDKLKNVLHEYRKKIHIRGISIPIQIVENVTISIGYKQVRRVCLSYLDGELDAIEVQWICDVLTLSSFVHFENENTMLIIEKLTDSDLINKNSMDSVVNSILISLPR
jgi:hypothetical protein